MRIDMRRTKNQPWNLSKRKNCLPQIFDNYEPLEVVYSTRVLGVIFSSSCRWDDHVNNMIQKANQKIWTLRRLKSQGASISTLIKLYKLLVRQGLKFAAPHWTFGLSKRNIQDIERIQARVTYLFLWKNELSYPERLAKLQLVSLEQRRLVLANTCSDKMVKDVRFKYLFPEKTVTYTRSKEKYATPFCRTNRLKNSAVPKFIEYQNGKTTQ